MFGGTYVDLTSLQPKATDAPDLHVSAAYQYHH
jgi:hypothetical protein